MKKLQVLVPAAALVLIGAGQPAEPAAGPESVRPVAREGRGQEWWMERHRQVLERLKSGPVDVVFIGDSITQGWEGEGRREWERRFAPLNAANLGFSGDRTQHVLWRLRNGELEGVRPGVAVVMIGTNNTGADSAADIAAGIREIVGELKSRQPEMRILLLGIFPRGEKPGPQRDKIADVNREIAGLADGKQVVFMDLRDRFVRDDGTIDRAVMPDYLHLSAKGYEIWGEAIEAKVRELLGTPGRE